MTDVSLVVTSCGRLDLLERTLDSFFAMNTYPLAHAILVEDSGSASVHEKLKQQWGNRFELILNGQREGQVASIDKAYERVRTPLIFHCEDDWEFTRRGFMEESLSVLGADENLSQVWLRHFFEVTQYTYDTRISRTVDDVLYRHVHRRPGYNWFGFSFNPGLLRKSCYDLVAPYAGCGGERRIGEALHKAGKISAVLEEGAVTHIGQGRHVQDPASATRPRAGSKIHRVLRLLMPPLFLRLLESLKRSS